MITTPTIEPDCQFSRLVAHSEAAEDLQINPKALRPCVGVMLKTSFCKGGIPHPSKAASIIACEFIRMEMPEELITARLEIWNRHNAPPIKQSDLRSTIRTALRSRYKYSCKHVELNMFCIGFEFCEHANGKNNQSRFNFRAFFTYHWQQILSNASKLVYCLALPELCKRRGLKPDGVIFANQIEIAQYAGISKKSVKPALLELESLSLIEYKRGTPRKWEGKASEIRRVFPIPKPPKSEILRVINEAF